MKKISMGIGVKKFLIAATDIIIINFSYIFIAFLYYKPDMPDEIAYALIGRIPYVTVIYIVLLWGFGLYNSIWKYAGLTEVVQCVFAVAIGSVASVGIDKAGNYLEIFHMVNFPALVYFSSMMLIIALVCALRLSYRAVRRYISNGNVFSRNGDNEKRVMIIGAGDMGMIIVKDLEARGYRMGRAIVFVDDNKGKQGRTLCGIPIRGGCEKIPDLVLKYKIDEIILAIPSAPNDRKSEIMQIAMQTKCILKTAPSLTDMTSEKAGLHQDRRLSLTQKFADI